MIKTEPYSDLAAFQVFKNLDPNDFLEAEVIRGAAETHLSLFADWRAVQGAMVLSLVITDHAVGGTPFAVLALSNTGQAGVAQAAMLSRSHRRYRRQLAEAARAIQIKLPQFCLDHGIHRVEARCWKDHPTASTFLKLTGFELETDMRGFGRTGEITFQQFAWTSPNLME